MVTRPRMHCGQCSQTNRFSNRMCHDLESKFSGKYLLRNNVTGDEENVDATVHDDQEAVFSSGVMKSLATVLAASFDGKGNKGRKRKRDDDDDDPDAPKGGARNIYVAKRGGNALDCYAKLKRDDASTRVANNEARAKKCAKKLQDCEATVRAFDAFVESCKLQPHENNGVWTKPYFETGKLDAKISTSSSTNLYPDKDLKAILLLLFPDSGMLSKKRDAKIEYIRDPKNFTKPWTRTQIDAELEAKKHELEGLRAAAAGATAAVVPVETPVETEVRPDDAGDDEDAEHGIEDAQSV